jgi:thiamine-phosphate pyrophosphorylase
LRGSGVLALWRAASTLRARAAPRKPLPPLLFFTDPVRTPRPERVIARLPRGSAVVFRAFGAADAEAQGVALARIARKRGVLFLVGADCVLAWRLRADGIHLPQHLAGRAGAIARLRRRFLVTAAAHDLPTALRARRAGVHAIVVSPVFDSASPSAAAPMGVRRFARLILRAAMPAYALGGVDAKTVRRLMGSRAVGVAAVGGLLT